MPPSVRVGEQERYVCQPFDTYASISRAKYRDDRYALALEEYNRNLPSAAQNVRDRPARLGAGTEVWIPTLDSLMASKYASLVSAGTAPTAPTPPSPPATSGVGTPPPFGSDPVTVRPLVPLVPASNAPTTTNPPAPAAVGTTTYRIPAGGQLISQVAEQRLGSALRWIDIYRLNPGLDPSRPIAEGTEIRLPTK
jgi:hypothetical protein